MNIEVKIVKTFPQSVKLKAFADLRIENCFAIHGLKVIDSEKGMFVAMPSTKAGDGYQDIFHPITKEARDQVTSLVLSEYERHLQYEMT